MAFKILPVVLAVISGVCYHLSQKMMPATLHPFVALAVTYVCASIVSIVLCLTSIPKPEWISAVKGTNMACLVLGIAVVGLELGFMLAYRSGWKVSSVGLVANTSVALLLIPMGYLIFKEQLTVQNMTGIALCLSGLVLIASK